MKHPASPHPCILIGIAPPSWSNTINLFAVYICFQMRKLIHSAATASWVRRAPLIVGIHRMTHSFEQVFLFWLTVSVCVRTCVCVCVFSHVWFQAGDYSYVESICQRRFRCALSSYINCLQVGKATCSVDLISGHAIEYPWRQISKPGEKNVVIVISRWAQLMMHGDGQCTLRELAVLMSKHKDRADVL